jgi:hypothetical protein
MGAADHCRTLAKQNLLLAAAIVPLSLVATLAE